jgi:hypothetical protein
MRIMLEEDLAHCTTLDEVQRQLIETLGYYTNEGIDVSYVAGPISADGDHKIPENIDKLILARGQIVRYFRQKGKNEVPFTAPFVFTSELYRKIGLFEMDREEREELLQKFWDEIILSGLVKAIYFIPGWERSPGAKKERYTAQTAGVTCYDLEL